MSLFFSEFTIGLAELDWNVIESEESVGIEIEILSDQNFISLLNSFTVRITPMTVADSIALGNLVIPLASSQFSPNLAGKNNYSKVTLILQ